MSRKRFMIISLLVSCAAILCFMDVSCTNPTSSNSIPIVGTWGNSVTQTVSGTTLTITQTLVFSSNGTFTGTQVTSGAVSSTINFSGTWTGSGSNYTLTANGSSTSATVSGSTLTVQGTVYIKS